MRYREIIMRVFNWSMAHRGIRMPGDRNPVKRVERPKENARTIRFLTLEQIDQQMEALADHPQLRAMVAVYIYAGLRREEALWLTRKDIDFHTGPHGAIHVRAKTINNEFWQPKTKVNRVVPISRALHSYLDRYEPGIVPGHWYFPSPEVTRWDADNFSRSHRIVQKTHGLHWNCLDYRHTFGSQLAMRGESLYKIATLMGNSPDICRRHYAVLLPDSLATAVEFDLQTSSLR
jgi:integrase